MKRSVRKKGDTWLFSYGSNLDRKQKEDRTKKIREERLCRLPRYRFAFNKQALDGGVKANIVQDEKEEVWGVVYRCSPKALERMDIYERVGGGDYIRTNVEVLTCSGEHLPAVTYMAGPKYVCAEGVPSRDYLERILRGAREHGLPEPYISQLERLGAATGSRGN